MGNTKPLRNWNQKASLRRLFQMSIERTIEDEFRRLKVLPEQKSLQKVSESEIIIDPSRLMQDYADTGVYHFKEMQKVKIRIEKEIKKTIASRNSVHGAYLGAKDFFAEKLYGKIITIDDLFGEMLYVLQIMGNDFESVIKRGDRMIENLDQAYQLLYAKGIENHNRMEQAKKRLDDMKILAETIKPFIEQTSTYEEKENYLFKKRELTKEIYDESFNIDTLEKAINRDNKRKITTDGLVKFFKIINHASQEVLNESRAYSETVRSTISPFLQIIRISKRYSEMNKVEEELGKLSSKTLDMFRDGAKKIAEARNRIGISGSSDRYIASINSGLYLSGYLES